MPVSSESFTSECSLPRTCPSCSTCNSGAPFPHEGGFVASCVQDINGWVDTSCSIALAK